MQDKDLLKETLKKYKKENYRVMSWSEYEVELKNLTTKVVDYITDNNLTVDVVVPILRGGNIPATYIAYALNVLAITPVQYKYFFVPGKCELRRLQSINKEIITKSNPVILLIEGNHCYGNQAKYAARDLKAEFPDSRIIYGASNMDYKYQDVIKDVEVSLYGNLTNCCKELSDTESEKLGIDYKQELIFPWENIEEEWDIVELKQHKYSNVDKLREISPLVAEYPL
jgi:hypothetical protein